jgi:hypothetical protein
MRIDTEYHKRQKARTMYLLDNQTLDNLIKAAELINLRYGNADNPLWSRLSDACLQARIEILDDRAPTNQSH